MHPKFSDEESKMLEKQLDILNESFSWICETYYEQALEEIGGGWFDGACWHLASASYDVLRLTGHDVTLCHVSRNPDSPDHAVVCWSHDCSRNGQGETLYLDADGLQTADQLINKIKIEGGFSGDWHITEDNQWNTSEIKQSALTQKLRNVLFEKITPSYYHVTPVENIPSILEHGLLPRIGENSADFGETIPAVFCFPTLQDCDTALGQWLGEIFMGEGEDDEDEGIELVIIEIKPKELPDRSDVPFEVAFHRAIPPSEISRVLNEDYTVRFVNPQEDPLALPEGITKSSNLYRQDLDKSA